MSEHDLALIRLVAGRYRELQGLRRVVDAGSLVFLWSLLRIGPVERDSGPYMLASLTWAALTMWSARRVVRYYRERFGSTPGDGTRWDETPGGTAYAGQRLLLVWTCMLMGGAFGAVLPLLTLYAARVTWRDWPYRPHWLLLVLEGTAFSLAFYSLDSAAQFHEWQWRFIWTAAPALVIVGLLDHRVLVHAMKASAETAPNQQHADTI
jgi:hypothetical protein